ncbi:MAG: hypothetical protein VKN83_09835 [Cyanobacteriota bacterium]|nr:hypothetical protein [Cyanobacteriota bacterium]
MVSLLESSSRALSEALALKLPAGRLHWLGTSLQIRVDPNASASERRVEAGTGPLQPQATTLGLGFGNSRFLPSSFSSPDLAVISGGGSLQGSSNATATATGPLAALVAANATNIGVANVHYLSRSSDPLLIGAAGNPFQAQATASSRSLLPTTTPAGGGPEVGLQAQALVRGLEGSPESGQTTLFRGQPTAFVRASSQVDLDPSSRTTAAATADAVGLENASILGVGFDDVVRIGGHATADWTVGGSQGRSAPPVQVEGQGIGIDQSTIVGASRADTLISGSGLAQLTSSLPISQLNVASPVKAIGIDRSTITTGLGTTLIMGTGEASSNLGSFPNAVVAGIADTKIISQGDAIIWGTTPNTPGTQGILRSDIVAANGHTSVLGTADSTTITSATGTTELLLEGARGVQFQGGGFGGDRINLNSAVDNAIHAGHGNDAITIGAGGGNVLDGGFGQNLITSLGGASRDTFVKANAGAAQDAADGRLFAEQLADPAFWNALSSQQKQDLWSTGEYRENGTVKGRVDTTIGFDPGAGGDTLALSSSLASMTQSYWQSNGAIFGIDNGALKVMDGPANSTMGVISGTLADIRSLVGTSGCSLAYATDTRQLLFDADGNWSQGTRSIGQLSMSDGDSLRKDNIQFA